MERLQYYFVITAAAGLLAMMPMQGSGQAAKTDAAQPAQAESQPCTGVAAAAGNVGNSANAIGGAATQLGNSASQIASAETKFKSMWGGSAKKTTTAATKAATTAKPAAPVAAAPASVQSATDATKNTASVAKPCTPAHNAAAKSTGAKTTPATTGAATNTGSTATAAKAGPDSGTVQSMTLMPDGGYMLGYSAPNSTDKVYVPVKRVSAAAKATSPNDGYYTDDKNFYTVAGSQVKVTPIGGASPPASASASAAPGAKP